MIDQHYTAPELARMLVEALPTSFIPAKIADFAAGEGQLIDPAIERWPKARVIVNDSCKRNASHLRAKYENAIVSCADFLSKRSVSSSKLTLLKASTDLILINPPFSQKGVPPIAVELNRQRFYVGSAMAFLCRALEFLSTSGVLIAVLPDGCLASNRDNLAWGELKKSYSVEIIRDNSRTAFAGVAARTSIVRMSTLPHGCTRIYSVDTVTTPPLSSYRGRCQMHGADLHQHKLGVPLVHTSELRMGRVEVGNLKVSGFTTITGPALLFPRVGRVTPEKIAILESGRSVVLSDCVLGLTCESASDAFIKRKEILAKWAEFACLYRGTGAPYVTVSRVAISLAAILGSSRDSGNGSSCLEVAVPSRIAVLEHG